MRSQDKVKSSWTLSHFLNKIQIPILVQDKPQALDPALTQAVNGNKASEGQRESGLQRVQGSHRTTRLQSPRETPLGNLREGQVVRVRAALGMCGRVNPRA